MDSARPLNFVDCRYLLIVFASVIILISASSNSRAETFRVEWDEARSQKELSAEKHVKRDTVLEAEVFESGNRFGFAHSPVRDAIEGTERITLRIEFDVSGRRASDRTFVEVVEVNKTGIPFTAFIYNNLMEMPENKRVVEIPIPKNYTTKWMSDPDAVIEFTFNAKFGMLSTVSSVSMKRPVLIFSRTFAPRCSEFTCCLSSKLHLIDEDSIIYHNLIMPTAVRHQRCIECSRTSEMGADRMDVFNLVIHGKVKVEDVKEPSQMGRCRATSWSSLPTTFVTGTGDNEHAVIKNVPYFNAESCECIEDEIPLDYEDIQAAHDQVALRKSTAEARSTSIAESP